MGVLLLLSSLLLPLLQLLLKPLLQHLLPLLLRLALPLLHLDHLQPAHVKACFLGSSLTLPISEGRLALGTWQGIWLCEHRNQAGSRKLMVTLQGCLRSDTSLTGSAGSGMRNSRSPAHPGADSPLASTSS
jgi:hypothetical protein